MYQRVIISAALVLFFVAQSDAAGPFGRRIIDRSSVAKPASPSYRHVLNSPEEMTRIFGPSILIRNTISVQETKALKKESRFVTQPVR